jgi:CO/xanthine dehydrogenase Mo-binding subunit
MEATLRYDAQVEKRTAGTTHLSISLPTEEAKILKRRATRVHGGNVARVVSDATRSVAYEEARDALIASFGEKGEPTAEEARRLDAEWGLSAKST